MAKIKPRVECRPVRIGGKPGPKTVWVRAHIRSTPTELPKTCKR